MPLPTHPRAALPPLCHPAGAPAGAGRLRLGTGGHFLSDRAVVHGGVTVPGGAQGRAVTEGCGTVGKIPSDSFFPSVIAESWYA